MQINHPGRQSPLGAGSRGFFEKNIAPSAIPLNLGPGLLARFSSSFVFGTPRHMTQADIDLVIKQFVECSRLAYEAGLQGVEIHAAHGYLLAQFLSADSNHRTDRYGGSVENRARLIIEIICAVRNAVPASFCVGVKLNSVDHQSRKALAACVIQLKMIVGTGIDFVEISGGTYEDPQMMQAAVQPQGEKSSHTLAREAFFLEFASVIRNEVPNISLLLTGGFRTRKGIAGAIKDDACDMAGIARPAALQPSLPNSVILNGKVPDEEARFIGNPFSPSWLVKISGQRAGAEFKWYSEQIQERGRQRQV
ncbi:hypothetical protein UA08_06122 [Talaromyces atroroseus]|uniref:NADH:flavin oxidoreductase/NADH oxidase N-terminal domain-containing protein n=1 Tax=Talaromyces atroroseus TaxID=1441469 RepID=A0A225AC45_TALAT|nr:hypothetical protein UA08_06122 [Talaromyces atroroseus]OKL58632.1 hypothetical protein UA08_06122 [Talaromyces atroroseus]